MNKEQKKKLSREKRRSQNEKRARLEKELEDMVDTEDELDVPEVEPVEKEYHGDFSSLSFDQLDNALAAKEKVEKVEETTWMVRDLVNNILYSSELDVEQKADAIKSVANDFGMRVRMIMDSPMEKASVDIDALGLEATLARDKRNMSLPERVKNMVAGIVQKTVDESKLEDNDFAFVIEREGVKVRKYPINNVAVVRKSIAEVSELAKQGDVDAILTMPRMKEVAKEKGIDISIETENNAIQIEKDANGDWRAVMWSSNNFKDRDGDIVEAAAHEEYVEWVNKEENKALMPVFSIAHIPGTGRTHTCDYVDYINGFLITSSKLTEQEAVGLLKAKMDENIGISIGGFGTRSPEDPRIITKYRLYEVSDLPLSKAANPFTDFETISKEVGMNNEWKMKYLAKVLGSDEKAEEYMNKAGLMSEALKDAGVENKEKTEETPVEPVVEPVAEAISDGKPNDTVAEVLKAIDIDGLKEFVVKTQAEQAQAALDREKIGILENVIKELRGDRDEELAKMIRPEAASVFPWSRSRPSASDGNIIKEGDPADQKLKEQTPGIPEENWLSIATGTVPIKEVV